MIRRAAGILLLAFTLALLSTGALLHKKEPSSALDELLAKPVATIQHIQNTHASDEKAANKPEEESETDGMYRDIKGMYMLARSANDDVIGWMYVPNGNSEPIVDEGPGPQYYLRRGLDHEYDAKGINFLSRLSEQSFAKNALIFGHKVRDGSRLGLISQYQNETYFATNDPLILYDGMADVFMIYQPFTVFERVDGKDNIRAKNVESEEERNDENFRRLAESQIEPSKAIADLVEGGDVLYLQTCAIEQSLWRLVVGFVQTDRVDGGGY